MVALSREEFLAGLPFATLRLDRDGRITFANAHAERLALAPGVTLTGRALTEALPALADARIADAMRRGPREGARVQVGDVGQELDVWLEPEPDGACTVFLMARQTPPGDEDISALRESLGRARRLYETVLGGTPDFAYIWSLDYKFLYANPALLRLYGLPAEKCIGYGFRDVGYPEWHAAMHEREIDEVARTGQPLRGKIPFYGKGGGGIYDYIFVPVLGPDGRVEAVGGLTRDVTELERTSEALKEADRRKDEFLATLAHELRNPLAPVMTGLGVLREAMGGATASGVLDAMERQMRHMVHLVDDLLDLSRISRGAIELRVGHHDLRQVLLQTVDSCQWLLQEHGHELALEVPDCALPVTGDDTRLSQIFSNLLNNAVKFTADGGTITVQATVSDAWVRVAVTDTGIGLREEDLSRVFEMFTQVESAPDSMRGGLGIGLHVVRRLVDMHGGAISASSPGLGKGSTFTVTLPLSTAAADTDALVPSPKPFRARRVLIVDDNVDAAFTLSLLLKHKGHDVHATYGAKDALDLARTFRPEVIFLDIGMPDLDGYEACRRIRQMDAVKHAYVVALTGWGQDQDRRHALEAGFDAHLVKPCEPERIEALLAGLPERIAAPTA